MRLISRILWLAAFAVATFCWFVLFEYGFGVDPFLEGASTELARIKDFVSGVLDDGATPAGPDGTSPTPQPAD